MTSITEQIQAQKQAKKENLKDLFYVDYCYHCRDPEIRGKEQVTCHHEWYCHHDNGDVQQLEAEIAMIQHRQWLRGYKCAYEIEELKSLRQQKWELIRQGRRNLPKVKV